jgi:tRNA G18 (ribose-2'-O)-methylase SpoU
MTLIPSSFAWLLRPAVGRTAQRTTSFRLFGGSRRRSRQKEEPPANLEWETFEFSESPKWDSRFDISSRTIAASSEHELEALVKKEAVQDEIAATKMNRQAAAWQRLSPEVVKRATEVLLGYVNSDRVERIDAVLEQRTQRVRFLFENPANPSNVWACLRTIESFGIQHVNVIVQSGKYRGRAALSQKKGMRTAMGSAQWLTVTNHPSTVEAVRKLREEQNCRIYASDLNPKSKDIRTIDWDDDDDRPICIVMGNENEGITDEMRELADETFSLPMSGFAESFNLSVATAITLAHLSAASQGDKGPLRPGDLSAHQYNRLKLKGLINSVAQKRIAVSLLRKEGIELPEEIDLL